MNQTSPYKKGAMPLQKWDAYLVLTLSRNERDYSLTPPVMKVIGSAFGGILSLFLIFVFLRQDSFIAKEIALVFLGCGSGFSFLGFLKGCRTYLQRKRFLKDFRILQDFYESQPSMLSEKNVRRALALIYRLNDALLQDYAAGLDEEKVSFLAQSEFVRLKIIAAKHPNVTREDLLFLLHKLVIGANTNVRDLALPRFLKISEAAELSELSANPYEDVRLSVAGHTDIPREICIQLATDSSLNVRQIALPEAIPKATHEELKDWMECPFADVKLAVISFLSVSKNEKGREILWTYIQDTSTQQEVVETLLTIEGNEAVSRILEKLGGNTTLRITKVDRLIEYFGGNAPEEIAAFVCSLKKESKNILMGKATEETTEYDSYGAPYTSTYKRDIYRQTSYFSPQMIEKLIKILQALDEPKALDEPIRQTVLDNQTFSIDAELAQILSLGLENGDWKGKILEPVIRVRNEIQESNFSPLPENQIISQLV